MTHEAFEELLSQYRQNKTRCDYLRVTMATLHHTLELCKEPSCQRELSGMPHGNGVSDPTARFALLSAQGWLSEDAKQVKGEIERCETEYKEKLMAVNIVDMVMGVLTEKERYVIEAKCFEEMTWAEVEERFEKNHEHHLSIATLKRTFQSAKLKMFAIAG